MCILVCLGRRCWRSRRRSGPAQIILVESGRRIHVITRIRGRRPFQSAIHIWQIHNLKSAWTAGRPGGPAWDSSRPAELKLTRSPESEPVRTMPTQAGFAVKGARAARAVNFCSGRHVALRLRHWQSRGAVGKAEKQADPKSRPWHACHTQFFWPGQFRGLTRI